VTAGLRSIVARKINSNLPRNHSNVCNSAIARHRA
jgi:hypothetical protein